MMTIAQRLDENMDDCLAEDCDQCDLMRDARHEIERLHDLHLERTKLTTKIIQERDILSAEGSRHREVLERIRDYDICADGIPEDFKYVQASAFHKFREWAGETLSVSTLRSEK